MVEWERGGGRIKGAETNMGETGKRVRIKYGDGGDRKEVQKAKSMDRNIHQCGERDWENH